MQARRDAAAGPTLASIRRDRELAPPELKPFFRYIEANPFDDDFSVAQMKQVCGIGDNSVSTRFSRHTGMWPIKYVLEHRLKVAWELLKRCTVRSRTGRRPDRCTVRRRTGCRWDR